MPRQPFLLQVPARTLQCLTDQLMHARPPAARLLNTVQFDVLQLCLLSCALAGAMFRGQNTSVGVNAQQASSAAGARCVQGKPHHHLKTTTTDTTFHIWQASEGPCLSVTACHPVGNYVADVSLPCHAEEEIANHHLQRSTSTPLCCTMPLSARASWVCMGPTSHVKKAGVMRALSSAPHLEYGNSFLNHCGTRGKPWITACLCSMAERPCRWRKFRLSTRVMMSCRHWTFSRHQP